MKNFLLVFLGGGVGSMLRYGLSVFTMRYWTWGSFPAGTFLVNLLGCLLIGLLMGTFSKTEPVARLLLIIGFCGGFTTFSTFSAENLELWQQEQWASLLIYIVLSLILGIAAVAGGMFLSRL